MSSQYTISLAHGQLEYHIPYPCSASIPSLLPKYSQFITFPAHVQSEYHLSCSCPVSTLSLLPSSSQNKYHMSCPSPSSTPFLLPMASENTTSPTHVKSCLCPTYSQFTISPVQVQSVHHHILEYHLYCPCPDITPSLLPILYISLNK